MSYYLKGRSSCDKSKQYPWTDTDHLDAPTSKQVHQSFLLQNVFRASKKIYCDFSVEMELENEKTESVDENENKVNKNVNEFQKYISQQFKTGKHKSETTSDIKNWNAI